MLEGERVAALPENDQLRGTPILVTPTDGATPRPERDYGLIRELSPLFVTVLFLCGLLLFGGVRKLG